MTNRAVFDNIKYLNQALTGRSMQGPAERETVPWLEGPLGAGMRKSPVSRRGAKLCRRRALTAQ